MKFFITGSFTYRNQHGRQTYINPQFSITRIFDTADPRTETDGTFVPPVIGLVAMDVAGQSALASARAHLDPEVQYPGIGKLPPNDIYNP